MRCARCRRIEAARRAQEEQRLQQRKMRGSGTVTPAGDAGGTKTPLGAVAHPSGLTSKDVDESSDSGKCAERMITCV